MSMVLTPQFISMEQGLTSVEWYVYGRRGKFSERQAEYVFRGTITDSAYSCGTPFRMDRH